MRGVCPGGVGGIRLGIDVSGSRTQKTRDLKRRGNWQYYSLRVPWCGGGGGPNVKAACDSGGEENTCWYRGKTEIGNCNLCYEKGAQALK